MPKTAGFLALLFKAALLIAVKGEARSDGWRSSTVRNQAGVRPADDELADTWRLREGPTV